MYPMYLCCTFEVNQTSLVCNQESKKQLDNVQQAHKDQTDQLNSELHNLKLSLQSRDDQVSALARERDVRSDACSFMHVSASSLPHQLC